MTQTNIKSFQVTVHERGNGFPAVGDYVKGDDGEVYQITKLNGTIHTGAPGVSNWMYAEVDRADWSDVTDETEPTCTATIEVQS